MKLRCVLALAGICFGAAMLRGQDFRSTLTGRIVDPSDSPVPEAAVVHPERKHQRHLLRQERFAGQLHRDPAPAGKLLGHRLRRRFQGGEAADMQLTVAETSTLDFKLELGGINQEVTVTAEVPLLESANADRGMVLGAQEVAEFPLNGRNPLMLGDLVPGVIYNGEMVYQRPFDNGAIARWDISGSSGTGQQRIPAGRRAQQRAGRHE